MKQNYVIYPSMLGITLGALWFKTDGSVSVFKKSNPIHISTDQCSGSTVCVWYISPLWQFNSPQPGSSVALLGDLDKWTPVSRQRFTSIVIDLANNLARVTFQGVPGEEIFILTFYPETFWAGTACFVTENGTGWANITPTILTCS